MDKKYERAGELLKQEEFLAKLSTCESDEEVQKLFEDNGAMLTTEDIEEMVKVSAVMANKDELNEDELEAVSGGLVLTTAACFVLGAGLISFFASYGYHSIKGSKKSKKTKKSKN